MSEAREGSTELRHRKMVPQATQEFPVGSVDSSKRQSNIMTASKESPSQSELKRAHTTKTFDSGGMPDDIYDESNRLTQPLLAAESDSGGGSDDATRLAVEGEHKTVIKVPEEAAWQIALQVFFPYIIAGFGMVAAGMVLDIVQVSIELKGLSYFNIQNI